MGCPDENVFARVMSGLLSSAELVAFHEHLDGCPACLELAGVLGCIDNRTALGQRLSDPNNPTQNASATAHPVVNAGRSSRRPGRSITALTTLCLCHAYSSFTLLPPLWEAFRANARPQSLALWGLYRIGLPFVLVFGSLGLLLSVLAVCHALFTGRPATLTVRTYACLALATGFLAPLGVVVLISNAREQARP